MPENEIISRDIFKGKKILIAVSGGIAVYKSVELVRLLLKRGAAVRVMMTESATRFVSPTTFSALTGSKVGISLWSEDGSPEVAHLEMPHWADLVIVAPATANILAKMAHGIADDLVSTGLLAVKSPLLIAPAMNSSMWLNPATRTNIEILIKRGIFQVGPESGELAHPDEEPGIGRMSEAAEIVDAADSILVKKEDLFNKKVLITAGRTEEKIDSVRVITNKSSGKMGCALAKVARNRGADVVLVHGPMDVQPPSGVKAVKISSALEMLESVKKFINDRDIIIYSAAVSDYRPAESIDGKYKREDNAINSISLVENPDISKETAKLTDAYKIGFALETSMNKENAVKKLNKKGLDAVILNTLSAISSSENKIEFYKKDGEVLKPEKMTKEKLANWIYDQI